MHLGAVNSTTKKTKPVTKHRIASRRGNSELLLLWRGLKIAELHSQLQVAVYSSERDYVCAKFNFVREYSISPKISHSIRVARNSATVGNSHSIFHVKSADSCHSVRQKINFVDSARKIN